TVSNLDPSDERQGVMRALRGSGGLLEGDPCRHARERAVGTNSQVLRVGAEVTLVVAEYTVAGPEGGDVGTDGLDHPGEFVSEDHGLRSAEPGDKPHEERAGGP